MCYLKGKNQGWLSADGVNYMYLLVDSVLAWMYNPVFDTLVRKNPSEFPETKDFRGFTVFHEKRTNTIFNSWSFEFIFYAFS